MDVINIRADIGAAREDLANLFRIFGIGAIHTGFQKCLDESDVGIGIGISPIFAHTENLARVSLPNF